MSKKLIIAEKPKLGREFIAPALDKIPNWKKYKTHWENDQYLITWAYGHLFELRVPEEYDEKCASWNLTDYPCLPNKYEIVLKRERDDKGKIIAFDKYDAGVLTQFNFIKKMILSKDIDEIICAGDPDEEGEGIVNDILDESGVKNKKITRIWFLDTTEKTISEAVKNRQDYSVTKGFAEFARARRISDWIYGINGSVLISTKYFSNSYVSVGRVQTPLLNLIVEREKDIRKFVPEQYFLTKGNFKTNKGIEYEGTLINDKGQNVQSKSGVKISNLNDAFISSITKSEKSIKPPKIYSTTTARQEISKRLKINSKEAEAIMNKLYEKGMISYPRSETEYIPDTMFDDIKDRIKNVQNIFKNKPYDKLKCTKNNSNVFQKAEKDGKIGSHYAIIPTLENKYNTLTSDEKEVYEMIVDKFLMAMLPDYTYLNTTMITELKTGGKFKTSGNAPLVSGWKELDKINKEKVLPVVEKNENVKVIDISNEENWTKAPSRYQESDLEELMKNIDKYIDDKESKKILKNSKGLGTPATRPDIIDRLFKSKLLLTEKQGKTTYVYPSEKGELLIEIVPNQIKDPVTTANWQVNLDELKEKGDAYDFVDKIVNEFKSISNNIKNDKQKSFSISNNTKNTLAKCPMCTGDLFETPKGYSCSNWNNEIEDRKCKFTVWKNSLEKLGKKTITTTELVKLLKDKKITVNLKSKTNTPYKKDYELIIDKENNTFKLEINWESNNTGGGTSTSSTTNSNSNTEKKSLGTCPVCKKGKIIDNPKAYSCSEWKDGCKYSIWKNSLEKFKGKLTESNVINLLTKGEDLVKIDTNNGSAYKKITVDPKYGIKINFQ